MKGYKYTPAKLRKAVNNYFMSISVERELTEKRGSEVVPVKNRLGDTVVVVDLVQPPMLSALCRYLGISRDTWARYSKLPEYAEICADAKSIVEIYLEGELLTRTKSLDGIKFALVNNFNWSEKKQVEVAASVTSGTVSDMTVDEKLALITEAAEAAGHGSGD